MRTERVNRLYKQYLLLSAHERHELQRLLSDDRQQELEKVVRFLLRGDTNVETKAGHSN